METVSVQASVAKLSKDGTQEGDKAQIDGSVHDSQVNKSMKTDLGGLINVQDSGVA